MDRQREILQAFSLEVIPFVLQLCKFLLRDILLAAFTEIREELLEVQLAHIVIRRGEEAVDRKMPERLILARRVIGKGGVDRVDLLLRERDVALQDAFQRLLMCGLRVFMFGCQPCKRAPGSRHGEKQREQHAQDARALLFRQKHNALLHGRPGKAQGRRSARRLRKDRSRIGKPLLRRELRGHGFVARQLRVAFGDDYGKPDERVPPVHNDRRRAAERPQRIQMPQVRQLVLHDQLRRVRLRHVRSQIDCRNESRQTR